MPLPGPQTAAYDCEADELFYGGAQGGGKCLTPDHEVLVNGRGWVSPEMILAGAAALAASAAARNDLGQVVEDVFRAMARVCPELRWGELVVREEASTQASRDGLPRDGAARIAAPPHQKE